MSSALQRLYALHAPTLRDALMRRFGEGPPDPEDAVQTAFARFIELDAEHKVERPHAFLFAMARNLMLDEMRRAGVRRRHAERAADAPDAAQVEETTPENVLLSQERFRTLNRAVGRLPERRRRLIVMSRIEGMSYAEIARATGMSPASISREIARTLVFLQEALESGEGGDRR
jgi:RNA polymerase sigma factor (sigma-70 family)